MKIKDALILAAKKYGYSYETAEDGSCRLHMGKKKKKRSSPSQA